MTVVTFGGIRSQEVIHKIGNWYKHCKTDNLFMLTRCSENKVAMVDVGCGNYWNDPVGVEDILSISQEEMERVTNNEFTLVPNINIQEA